MPVKNIKKIEGISPIILQVDGKRIYPVPNIVLDISNNTLSCSLKVNVFGMNLSD